MTFLEIVGMLFLWWVSVKFCIVAGMTTKTFLDDPWSYSLVEVAKTFWYLWMVGLFHVWMDGTLKDED